MAPEKDEKHRPSSPDSASYDDPPPPFSARDIELHDNDVHTHASLADDGRVNIDISGRVDELAVWLPPDDQSEPPPPYVACRPLAKDAPAMNIVVQVVGSRGDVQPFIALARSLQRHGHRVRLATHPKFERFVEDHGIEFFSIGGDPEELMDFMVNHQGLVPSVSALLNGDISRKRAFIADLLQGCWRSCIEPPSNAPDACPFVADAIIANPPSFAHLHCAERLGIPLHFMFTMPWTPTRHFAHPLASVQATAAGPSLSNYMSFGLVDTMTWHGLGDIVNHFRQNTLGLEPINPAFASGLPCRLQIPFTYCWSPSLLPRPTDWGKHVNISGYFTDPAHSEHHPVPELAAFLSAGDEPLYIGFGSIPIPNAGAATRTLLAAIAATGVRAIISRGWARLGADLAAHEAPPRDRVVFVDDTPHPWLFPQCAAVVHHGGAGTTAAGLALGRPTVVVPFFGDQFFWGDMVARRGAGPAPIPFRQLSVDRLVAAIRVALDPATRAVAEEVADGVRGEDGAEAGAAYFHGALEGVLRERCAVAPERVPVWRVKGRGKGKGKGEGEEGRPLSAVAAAVLMREGVIERSDLELIRIHEYDVVGVNAPYDMVSSLMVNTFGTVGDILMGVASGPIEAYRQARKGWAGDKGKHRASQDIVESSAAGETSSASGKGSIKAPSVHSDRTPSVSSRGATEPAPSASSSQNPYAAVAVSSGKGLARTMGAALKTPATFTHGLSRGFNNVPRLYGDTTVRKEEKVTGFKSGMVAAGKGFGYGLYDGLTGFVTQPVQGAQKEGAVGFLKGFGKGVGGIIFKPAAGACGVPGNAFMGVYKSLQKLRSGKSTLEAFATESRIAQGEIEMLGLEEKERSQILARAESLR